MAHLTGYLGGAGTGKTTKLVAAVVQQHPTDGVRPILALTFMHGARRRLSGRLLESCGAEAPRIVCQTIDSFCLALVRRFRSILGLADRVVYPTSEPTGSAAGGDFLAAYFTFEEIRSKASAILGHEWAREWIACSYTCVVVDEFQDCSEALLEIVKRLRECLPTYVAADEFQLLDRMEACPAVSWLHDSGEVVRLEQVHRTDTPHLLAAARALREGKAMPTALEVIGCSGPGLAAWELAKRIAWSGWGPGRSIACALLTPVGPEKADFVRKMLDSLEKQLGQSRQVGPYPFAREGASESAAEATDTLAAALADDTDPVSVERLERLSAEFPCLKRLSLLASASGVEGICKFEMLEAARRMAQTAKRVGWTGERGRIATTIHGAKNREFDYVAVVWPYQVSGDLEYQRRLLYNGITRARRDAIVLVQGGNSAVARSAVLQLLLG